MSLEQTIIHRRGLLLGMASMTAALAGCTSLPGGAPVPGQAARPIGPPGPEELATRYAAMEDGGYKLPAIPYQQIDPRLYRQRVRNTTGEPAGTVVVDTPTNFLYVVEPGGTAMRYGVGLGRAGFA